MNDLAWVMIAIAVALASAAIAYWLGKKRAWLFAKKNFDSRLHEFRLEMREKELQGRESIEDERLALLADQRRAREELDRKRERVSERESQLNDKEQTLIQRREELNDRERAISEQAQGITDRLREVAGLSKKEARDRYLEHVEQEYREEATLRVRELEEQAAADARRRARRILIEAMERSATEYVAEATTSVVPLPGEDMKGRLIGREGRNIRSFEQVTGVDLIVDDTPEAVVISCFDPVRREVARLALINLILDGRIHPARIEELHEKAKADVRRVMEEAGEDAVHRSQVGSLPDPVVQKLGELRFRTSYGQNLLDHSVEVASIAGAIAAELDANIRVARRAGLLHDIGKALGSEWSGPHALTGMEFLKGHGEPKSVLNAVGAHHYEIQPETAEAHLVILADILSASRPGARRESLETFLQRLHDIEEIAMEYEGVDRAYAIQAGRELRVLVKPELVDDLQAKKLAASLARRLQQDKELPGQLTVTVIRETRSQEKTE